MNKLRLPHPATMFFLLTLAVIFLSWIAEVYGLSAVDSQTGEEVRVQSLLSAEGIRWMLRHAVSNFTDFAPFGQLLVGALGIGLAQHSGFIPACYRQCWRRKSVAFKPLSRKERRAMIGALLVGGAYVGVVWCLTFSSWAILRSVNGGLVNSPFMVGLLFLVSAGVGLMGMVYGFASGRYRADSDVVDGLAYLVRLLSVFWVIMFFAAQMYACLEYSRLPQCFALLCAGFVPSVVMEGVWYLLFALPFLPYLSRLLRL